MNTRARYRRGMRSRNRERVIRDATREKGSETRTLPAGTKTPRATESMKGLPRERDKIIPPKRAEGPGPLSRLSTQHRIRSARGRRSVRNRVSMVRPRRMTTRRVTTLARGRKRSRMGKSVQHRRQVVHDVRQRCARKTTQHLLQHVGEKIKACAHEGRR